VDFKNNLAQKSQKVTKASNKSIELLSSAFSRKQKLSFYFIKTFV